MSDPKIPEFQLWQEAARWLYYATDDIGVIEAVLKQPAPSLLGAAMHCQQAAEKMAKAVLIAFGNRPPRIHDLGRLARLVQSVRSDIGAELWAMAEITTWYAAARYPDVAFDTLPTLEEIHSVLAKLRALHERILALAPKAR